MSRNRPRSTRRAGLALLALLLGAVAPTVAGCTNPSPSTPAPTTSPGVSASQAKDIAVALVRDRLVPDQVQVLGITASDGVWIRDHWRVRVEARIRTSPDSPLIAYWAYDIGVDPANGRAWVEAQG